MMSECPVIRLASSAVSRALKSGAEAGCFAELEPPLALPPSVELAARVPAAGERRCRERCRYHGHEPCRTSP